MKNLADEPGHQELKETLRVELEAELKRTGDPRILGNGDVFEKAEYIVDAPHSWAHYLNGDWKPQSY